MRRLPIDYAVRNLGRSTTRLLLSILGSVLVVLLVISAGGFVRGMANSLRNAGDAQNVMVMGVGSEDSLERSEIPAATASLLEATVPGLRTQFGQSFVSPEVHVQLPVRDAEQSGSQAAADSGNLTLVRGVTPAAMLVHGQVQIVEGRFPLPGHNELLAGRLANLRMGNSHTQPLAIGTKLRIENREWTVVGVLAAPQTVIDAEIWMPLSDLKELTKRVTDSCVVVTLGSGPGAAELADIQMFCRQRLDLEITAMSESTYYRRLAAFFAPIRAVTWITAGLIAMCGLFGGLNTMYAAFASRVREIGMLQCLGFRRLAIVISLVQESCLTTATGAVIACGLALYFLNGLAVQFSMGAFGLEIDAPVLLMGMAAALALGLFGALPPAFRCLRLPIPESLKAI
jgi:putative ABC transport system permease protein